MINIKTDSRKVQKGDTFVAIKGATVDGHDYIESAIKNGATKIICEHGNYDVDTLIVPDTKEYLQNYIVSNFKDEVNKLDIIGITGTNGKTTTSYLTYQMLNKLGVKTAYIGTIGFYIDDDIKELPNTTPEIPTCDVNINCSVPFFLSSANILIVNIGTVIINPYNAT